MQISDERRKNVEEYLDSICRESEQEFAQNIDVTKTARDLLFPEAVMMDPEAFGVCVTRRQDANEGNLTPHERARLLDVLCHAQSVQRQARFAAKEFPIWVVSSDARDARPRALWLTLRWVAYGYNIKLSDYQSGV